MVAQSWAWLVVVSLLMPVALAADESEPLSFDRDIAPLLAAKCLGCHDGNAQKGGLDLASAARLAAGGDSGPAVRPGEPEQSLMWQRIVADEMPPRTPLAEREKSILRRWIAEGAKWGTDPIDPFRFSTEVRAGYDWWSLKPVSQPPLPSVRDTSWPRNEIDLFILEKLETKGLKPAEPADARLLLRRLYLDLIGLPPVLRESNGRLYEDVLKQEVDLTAFRDDPAEYSRVVEELLASPHYGERWARHWLDVIRFGESQGFERNRIRENAWRYRDWVVDAFNHELPYDEFVRQQLAGDVLYPNDLDALLATGFLVCGTWDQVGHREGSKEMQRAVREDHLEDLVGAVGQSILGLTTNCARCHDHKFDPISQREYYEFAAALGGVTQEENERQGIAATPGSHQYLRLITELDQHRSELRGFEDSLRRKYAESLQTGKPGDSESVDSLSGLQMLFRPGLHASGDSATTGIATTDAATSSARTTGYKTVGKWPYVSAEACSTLASSIRAGNEFSVEVWLTPSNLTQKGPARIVTLSMDSGRRNFTLAQDGDHFDLRLRTSKTDQNGLPSTLMPDQSVSLQKTHVVYTYHRSGELNGYLNGKRVVSRTDVGNLSNWDDSFRLAIGDEVSGGRPWTGELHFAAIYSQALTQDEVQSHFETQSESVGISDSQSVVLAQANDEEKSRHSELARAILAAEDSLKKFEQRTPRYAFTGQAHVVIPRQPSVFHVLARGDHRNPRDEVSPGGLRALSQGGLVSEFGLKADAPEAERRLALAKWMTDARNPLTPRVLVNRLWYYHFGQGIVDTPSDFGFSGGRPSHPELLDWLARRFVDGGWRVKGIHRLIVTSAAWRQSSMVKNEKAAELDAENRLLWRANSRRLDGESLRDSILAVSGVLNTEVGGPGYRDIKVNGGAMGTNAEFTEPTGEFTEATCRRTIYRLWARSGNNPLLQSFDCADPSVSSPRRAVTITPLQSLSLLNNSFVENSASRLADRIRLESGSSIEEQTKRLFSLVLGRVPVEDELKLTQRLVEQRGLEQLAIVLINTNEFLFVE
ncbi:MAG: DUF1553 domain-containing protein [Planctomyces sp.]|nr:DUF1553 domain-containing protein [Planctomyces sp.]